MKKRGFVKPTLTYFVLLEGLMATPAGFADSPASGQARDESALI